MAFRKPQYVQYQASVLTGTGMHEECASTGGFTGIYMGEWMFATVHHCPADNITYVDFPGVPSPMPVSALVELLTSAAKAAQASADAKKTPT